MKNKVGNDPKNTHLLYLWQKVVKWDGYLFETGEANEKIWSCYRYEISNHYHYSFLQKLIDLRSISKETFVITTVKLSSWLNR